MDNAQRAERSRLESQSVSRNSREVPIDWFVDPADPSAGHDLATLEDRGTAYLAAHDAVTDRQYRGRHPGRHRHRTASRHRSRARSPRDD